MKVNKKIFLLGFFILIFALIPLLAFKLRPLIFLNNFIVDEIFIYKNDAEPRVGFYIGKDGAEDFASITKTLKSIKTGRRFKSDSYKVNYTIYINLKNGDNIAVGILPDNGVIIGSKLYTTDKDYNGDFNEIISDLSIRYKNILN